jgi:uncharacterized protein (TIGR02246 family)
MDASGTADFVAALEDRRFAAMRAKDFPTLELLFGEDMTYTHSSGSQDSKKTYLAALHDGVFEYHSMDVQERDVRVYGDVAVVFSRVVTDLTNRGVRKTLDNRTLCVWRRVDGAWKMVAYQPTVMNRS